MEKIFQVYDYETNEKLGEFRVYGWTRIFSKAYLELFPGRILHIYVFKASASHEFLGDFDYSDDIYSVGYDEEKECLLFR